MIASISGPKNLQLNNSFVVRKHQECRVWTAGGSELFDSLVLITAWRNADGEDERVFAQNV